MNRTWSLRKLMVRALRPHTTAPIVTRRPAFDRIEGLEDRTTPTTLQFGLFDTGTGANGTPDAHYILTQSADNRPGHFGPAAFVQGATAVSPSASGAALPGQYTYETTFDLTGYDPTRATLTGTAVSDDGVTDILLNGVTTGFRNGAFTIPAGFGGFRAGINTLTFVTRNQDGGGGAENPTNLTASGLTLTDTDVLVVGTAGNDNLVVTATGPAAGSYSLNGGAAVNFAGITSFTFQGGAGNDSLVVDSSTSLLTIGTGISYDGGTGSNSLALRQTGGTTQTSDTYTVGPNPGQGTSAITGPAGTQTVSFVNLAPVTDNVPASTMTVNGTAADNAITYAQGSGGGIFAGNTGLVTVDNQESFEFNNKTNLVLNGRAGSDTINLHYNNTANPAGLTGTITIAGGDPTGSDTLIVNGIDGVLDNLRYLPTAAGAGTVINDSQPQPNVLFTGVEHLTMVVRAADGDGLRLEGTAGNDAFEFIPGLTGDSGSFVGTMDQNNATGVGPFAMTPMQYTGAFPLANDLDVNFFNPGGTDSFVFNGTANDDNIVVSGGQAGGTNFSNTLNGILVSNLEVFNIASGLVRGLTGNDTITVNAPAGPAAVALRVEGGDSDTATDTLNYNSPGGAATTIDLGASTISSTGGNTVTFTGAEAVNVNDNGGSLAVTGTAGDDSFQVQPTAAGAGNFTRQGVGGSPQFTYTGAGAGVTFDGGTGGFDVLAVLGDGSADAVTATATTVTRAGGTVTVGANLDRLDVDTFGGNDTITLTTFTALPTRIDAGDGDDQVFGSTQPDLIYGGSGNDFLIGGGGNDVVYGGDGNDSFGDPLVRDPAANDPGNDTFYGEGGSDSFFWDPGDGSDVIEGGAGGSDQIFFSGNAGAEQFFLFADAATPSRFHLFRVQAAINIDAADVEEVNLIALGGADTVTVGRSDPGTGSVLGDLSTTTVRSVDVSLGVDGAADNVVFEGRPADDNLLVSLSGGTVKVAGLSYDLRVDGADAALDRLTVNGNDGNDTVTAAAGVETAIGLTLNGGVGNDSLSANGNLNGNEGDDTLVGGPGNNAMDGGTGDDTFIGGGGTDAIGGGVGSSVGDTILVGGTTGNDTISLSLDALGHLLATVNGVTTTYTNFLGGPIASSGIEHIQVNGLAGNDVLTVDSTNGAVPVPINVDGGDNADQLVLTGGTATSDTYAPGPNPGQGTSTIVIGGVTQTVSFSALEPVIDLVAGPLVVSGTNADNAINYAVGRNDTDTADDPTRGRVSIDNAETIDFSNKTGLTINGLAGSDTINLNNPNTPTGLTGTIAVNGGDPTGTGSGVDTLIANSVGRNLILEPTALGAGTVTYFGGGFPDTPFTGIESLRLVDTATNPFGVDGTAGDDQFTYTPGATPDTGTVTGVMNSGAAQFPLVPVTFSNIQVLGAVVFNAFGQQGGTDSFVFNGTAGNDAISVTNGGVFGGITLSDTVTGTLFANLNLNNMGGGLTVQGNAGANAYTHDGNVPVPVTYAGGAADTLTFNGNGAPVTVDLAAKTVTDGAGTVTFGGTGTVNVNAGGSTVTVVGTTGNDSLTYTPTGAAAGTVTAAGLSTVFNFTNVSAAAGGFTVDGNGGSDQLVVRGTQSADTIDVNTAASGANTVLVAGLLAVNYNAALAHVEVDALAGSDTFNVAPSTTTTFLADGGDPIGVLPGDTVNLIHPAAAPFLLFPGPTSDSGGMATAGFQTVSWAHIETFPGGGGGGGAPPVVAGTGGGDDTITVIARDSSYNPALPGVPNPLLDGVQDFTVSVNGGPDMLFVNQPFLFLDGLGGNDTIVVRETAPNQAVWNVQVFVAGGPPAAGANPRGDTIQLETPGTQTVTYSPNNPLASVPPVPGVVFSTPAAGGGQFSDATNGTTVTAVEFLIPLFYQSSPGGVEQFVYAGQAGNDTLVYNTPDNANAGSNLVYTPGATADAGSVTGTRVGGAALTPLTFSGLGGTGAVSFTTANAGGRTDRLTVQGSPNAVGESFAVTPANGGTVQVARLTGGANPVTLPITTPAVATLELQGLGGSDTFSLTGSLPYTRVLVNDGATVNLTAAAGPVTVTLGDNTPGSANPNTVITGYGGQVTLIDVATANLDATNNQVTATGTTQNDNIVYTPTGAAAGTFYDDVPSGNNPVPNTVFNIANATGNFRVFNDPAGNADRVTLRGTAARDLFQINQASGVAQVLANNVTALLPVELGISVEILTAQGLGGQDTFQVIPGAGIAGQAQDNMLVNIDGGGSGENNALVIGSSFGASPGQLAANQFVVVNRGAADGTGTVRVFTAAVANPDINYQNVQVVTPNASGTGLNVNLLVMGADTNEPNEQLGNPAFLGAAATATVQHAAIFPGNTEFPGAPDDQDFYRVVANKTGFLTFDVFFRTFAPALLPGGGQLQLQAFDQTGAAVASPAVGVSTLTIPVVTGQTYYLRVAGGAAGVVNGYDAAVTVTPAAAPPILTVTSPVAGNEGAPIPLTITVALTDPLETAKVSITGFPTGTVFSAGVNNGVSVELTPAQLAGLTVTFPDGAVGGTVYNLQVTATATNADGTTATVPATPATNLVVTVNNVAPTATLGNSGPVNEGSTGTVTFSGQADPGLPDVVAGFHYAYDFDNDGTFELGDGTFAGSPSGPTVTVPANFLADGPATLTVRGRIIDKDGGFTDYTTTITVNNVAPTATFAVTGPFVPGQPSPVTFSHQFDPSPADTAAGFTYQYDLGTGVFGPPTTSPTATFVPPAPGTYVIRGRIIDKDGGVTEYTVSVPGSQPGVVVVPNVDRFAVAAGPGGGPEIQIYSAATGERLTSLDAYEPSFRGGVNVAMADVTGDGIPDIIAGSGPGGGPAVKVFDGRTLNLIASFYAYEGSFRGGVNVAAGDLFGTGRSVIIAGSGVGGGPAVKVFDVTGKLLNSFYAYADSLRGGVNVGAADTNGDGRDEILTGAGVGGGPNVRVFNADGQLQLSFFAYDASFTGGVYVSGGNLLGNGHAQIVTGTGVGGGPDLREFDGQTGKFVASTFAFGPDVAGRPLTNGFTVNARHIGGATGRPVVIVGAGPDYGPTARVLAGSPFGGDAFTLVPFDESFTGGVYVG